MLSIEIITIFNLCLNSANFNIQLNLKLNLSIRTVRNEQFKLNQFL